MPFHDDSDHKEQRYIVSGKDLRRVRSVFLFSMLITMWLGGGLILGFGIPFIITSVDSKDVFPCTVDNAEVSIDPSKTVHMHKVVVFLNVRNRVGEKTERMASWLYASETLASRMFDDMKQQINRTLLCVCKGHGEIIRVTDTTTIERGSWALHLSEVIVYSVVMMLAMIASVLLWISFLSFSYRVVAIDNSTKGD